MMTQLNRKNFLYIGVFAGILFWGCVDGNSGGGERVDPIRINDPNAAPQPCVNVECPVDQVCVEGECVAAGQSEPTQHSERDRGVDSQVGAPGPDDPIDALDASAPPPPPQPAGDPWLLSFRGETNELIKIDTASGRIVPICEFSTMDGGYPSTTFGKNGVLYGFNGRHSAIDIIDPCTCEVERVGVTQDAAGTIFEHVPGITANGMKVEALYGLSTEDDVLLDIDVNTAISEIIGPLGVNFRFAGTTWSDEHGGLYAINNLTDQLYDLNILTGEATPIAQLNVNFATVGIEYHHYEQALYGCTNMAGGKLYRINTTNGRSTLVTNLNYGCNNLAAPWFPVPCVDELEFD